MSLYIPLAMTARVGDYFSKQKCIKINLQKSDKYILLLSQTNFFYKTISFETQSGGEFKKLTLNFRLFSVFVFFFIALLSKVENETGIKWDIWRVQISKGLPTAWSHMAIYIYLHFMPPTTSNTIELNFL